MSSILRVATDIGWHEIRALAGENWNSTVVLGNTDQNFPREGVIARKVIPSRLENMARACARLRPFQEIRISGNAKVANALFADKGIRSRLNSWVVSSVDPARIESDIHDLDLGLVDEILTLSPLAKSLLERRLSESVPIRVLNDLPPGNPRSVSVTPQRLVWAGSPNPAEGLQDFTRIAALTQLPTKIMWTRSPSPAEFTAAVSAITMLRIEDQVEFGVPGTYEAFERAVKDSEAHGDVWIGTARDYPPRSVYEFIATLGAPLISFDSMYARGLARAAQGQFHLVPEGGVVEAADVVNALVGDNRHE